MRFYCYIFEKYLESSRNCYGDVKPKLILKKITPNNYWKNRGCKKGNPLFSVISKNLGDWKKAPDAGEGKMARHGWKYHQLNEAKLQTCGEIGGRPMGLRLSITTLLTNTQQKIYDSLLLFSHKLCLTFDPMSYTASVSFCLWNFPGKTTRGICHFSPG